MQHEYQANDLVRILSNGEEFTRLAQKYSLCSSAPGGGDLGTVSIDRLDEDFVEAAVRLKTFEISTPVRTKFGWHIIQKLS